MLITLNAKHICALVSTVMVEGLHTKYDNLSKLNDMHFCHLLTEMIA